MNPTADWEKLGERYYRKIQLYTEVFDQDLELENHIVTGAPYGGAIGMSISIILGFGVLLPCFWFYLPLIKNPPAPTPFDSYSSMFWAGTRLPSYTNSCHSSIP